MRLVRHAPYWRAHRVPSLLLVVEAAGMLLVRHLSPGCSHCWPCLPCCHHTTHTHTHTPHSRAPQVYDVLNADRIVVEQSALAYLNKWFDESQAKGSITTTTICLLSAAPLEAPIRRRRHEAPAGAARIPCRFSPRRNHPHFPRLESL